MCAAGNTGLESTDAFLDAANEAGHSPAVDVLDEHVYSQYIAGIPEVPLVEKTARPAPPGAAASIRRGADHGHLPAPEARSLHAASVLMAYAHLP